MSDNKNMLLLESAKSLKVEGAGTINRWCKATNDSVALFIKGITTAEGNTGLSADQLRAMISGIPSPWARVLMTKKALAENPSNLGDTVLDIGCGSGILAIASMLLGAKEGFGVDIDELAVKTAKENGKMNGFDEPELKFVCGDLADKVTKQYDVVVANIVADIIILFSTQVRAFMKQGAKFIASGIIDTRADEVVSALQRAGLKLIERIEQGGWVCLVCE